MPAEEAQTIWERSKELFDAESRIITQQLRDRFVQAVRSMGYLVVAVGPNGDNGPNYENLRLAHTQFDRSNIYVQVYHNQWSIVFQPTRFGDRLYVTMNRSQPVKIEHKFRTTSFVKAYNRINRHIKQYEKQNKEKLAVQLLVPSIPTRNWLAV